MMMRRTQPAKLLCFLLTILSLMMISRKLCLPFKTHDRVQGERISTMRAQDIILEILV